jgi:hypothetical protein
MSRRKDSYDVARLVGATREEKNDVPASVVIEFVLSSIAGLPAYDFTVPRFCDWNSRDDGGGQRNGYGNERQLHFAGNEDDHPKRETKTQP